MKRGSEFRAQEIIIAHNNNHYSRHPVAARVSNLTKRTANKLTKSHTSYCLNNWITPYIPIVLFYFYGMVLIRPPRRRRIQLQLQIASECSQLALSEDRVSISIDLRKKKGKTVRVLCRVKSGVDHLVFNKVNKI